MISRRVPREHQSLRSFGEAQTRAFSIKKDYGLLSWNAFKGKKKGWETDFSRLSSIYDLILLQEARIDFSNINPNTYSPLFNWVFGESFELEAQRESCGVLTGSPIQEVKAFNRHAPITEPFLNTPKSTAFSYYDIEGREDTLLIINAHFINFRSHYAFEKQLQQVVKVVDQHQGPILFAGDFNTWSKKREQSLLKTLSAHGLYHVDFHNDARRFLTLDYIFQRKLLIKEAHMLYDIKSSDHTPLTLWFEIPQKS